VVLGDVEHGRGVRLEALGVIELEARELENPDVREVLENRRGGWRRSEVERGARLIVTGDVGGGVGHVGLGQPVFAVVGGLPALTLGPSPRGREKVFGENVGIDRSISLSPWERAGVRTCRLHIPMLPAIATRRPVRSISIAAIEVVVVLPLVPVMATTLGA
jgi:hypothetical protein